MAKKKILITGGSGFLGWHLARLLAKKYEVCATYCSHPFTMSGVRTIRMDTTSENGVAGQVVELKPDVVVHAVANTNVDGCEENKEDAYRTNVTGTVNVLKAVEDIGAFMIYTSTDLVFGEGKSMYTEEDSPYPINYYGWTKLEGEKKVASCESAVTLRMALMYGADTGIKGSFLRWIKKGLDTGEKVRLYTDQYRTPLYVDDAVAAIDAVIQGKARRDLYHIAGPERIDRYSFGLVYAGVFGYDPAPLVPVKTGDVPPIARRSRDCSMSIERARQDLGFNPRAVREALLDLKKNLLLQNSEVRSPRL